MMHVIAAYLVVSFIVGVIDLIRMAHQEDELASYPVGDIGYYVFPTKITGVHNWIFLPSWLVIKGWIGICRIANRYYE
jgi:hypothetical protein